MKDFLLNLNAYDLKTNQAIISHLYNNKNNISNKSIELVSHILLAHSIWNNRVFNNNSLINSWDTLLINYLSDLNVTLHNQSEHIINNYELETIISYKNRKGEILSNTIYDMLFQIYNHSNYHRAQINYEMRLNGFQPLELDYIQYVQK